MAYKLISLITVLFLSLACVVSVDPTLTPNPTIWAPTQTETYTPTATNTPTPTNIPTPTATPTSTATPTATSTPTVDWSATPTQLTPSTAIIEVTPLGGEGYKADGWQAFPSDTYYQSDNNLNIRSGPGMDKDVVGQLGAGRRVLVYAMHYWKYSGDRWLCLDEPQTPVDKEFVCLRNVAYIVGGAQWGDLYLPDY